MLKRTAFLLGLAVLMLGCSTTAEVNAIAARAKALEVAPEYIIEEGDSITIQVLGEDQPVVTHTVRPDGQVSFPNHGDILVKGKTPEALRAELEQDFKQTLGLRNPKVYVAVNAFTSKSVTVLGQVLRPGRYPYTGQMRVADLLGRAIGVPPVTGAPNRALLFREVEGKTKVYKVRLKDFFHEADFRTNFYVRPGDILWVPMNGFAVVATQIEKVLLPVAAFVQGIGLGRQVTTVFIPGE